MQSKYQVGYLVVDVFSAYGDFHMDTVGIIVEVIVKDHIDTFDQRVFYKIHWRFDNRIEPIGESLLELWCMVYDKEGNVVHGPKPIPSILD
jgi:hypothetical protein|tara:strand:+ start:741 stop:1013 length:273 start_codon:yes stop_codon:yes gene_type:complete